MKTKLSLVVGLAFLLGCSHHPRLYFEPGYNFSGEKRVAVLPFENLSSEEDSGEKVQKIFLVELLKNKKFYVLELGEVEKALKELRLRGTDKLSAADCMKLQEKLGVEWIFLGSVLEFSQKRQGTEEIPVVSLTARVLEAKTGKIIWAAFASRQGDDSEVLFGIGKINSASELAKKIAQKMVLSLRQKSQK